MDAVAIAKLMRERLVQIEEWLGPEYVAERDGLRCALRCLGEHVPMTHRPGKGRRSHHTLEDVRDYAVAQEANGRFTVTRMCEDMGIPRAKADGYMRELADQGVVKQLSGLRGYKYVPIPKQAAQRQRMAEKRSNASNGGKGNGYSNASAVPGTGGRNNLRARDDETNALIREVQAAGAEVRRDSTSHFGVYQQGTRVGTLAASPSDHRSVRNARAQLKRRGVAV